jgi:hypothetical protein
MISFFGNQLSWRGRALLRCGHIGIEVQRVFSKRFPPALTCAGRATRDERMRKESACNNAHENKRVVFNPSLFYFV